MDRELSLLFDYQLFEQDAELQSVIDAVSARFPSRLLSDDEADLVAAAGQPEMALLRKNPLNKENESS